MLIFLSYFTFSSLGPEHIGMYEWKRTDDSERPRGDAVLPRPPDGAEDVQSVRDPRLPSAPDETTQYSSHYWGKSV